MALIITHRMGSVRQANEIIVLDKGKLIEQGNFETLMKKQGLFSELYLKQQTNERLKCLVILGIISKDSNLNKECHHVWE